MCLRWKPAFAGVLTAWLLLAPGAEANESLALRALPTVATLSPNRTTTVEVIATNVGSDRVTGIRLTPLQTGAAVVGFDVEPDRLLSLEPGATRSWDLSLDPLRDLRGAPGIQLVVRYRTRTGGREVGIVPLDLKPPAAVKGEEIVKLEIQAALSTLRSGQSAPVYLLVSNVSAQKLRTMPIRAKGPDFIRFDGLGQTRSLKAGSVAVIEVDVVAESRVRPGEHQLVFRVPIRVGARHAVDVAAAKTVKVGVAGESDLLIALGIPSLLLAPGFILLATMSLWWRVRLLRKDWDSAEFPIEVKSAEFWVLAIGISIAFLAGWALAGIDLLDQYGVEDLVYLWVISFAVGTVLYLVVNSTRRFYWSSRLPRTSDTPTKLLRKLDKQGMGTSRPRRVVDPGAGDAVQMYLLQPPDPGRPASWVAPQIDYRWVGDRDAALAERIGDCLNTAKDAKRLADLLDSGESSGKLSVEWSRSAMPYRGPRLLPAGKLAKEKAPAPIAGEAA